MTVSRRLVARFAAVGVCVAVLAGMANAEISGRVVAPDLTAIDSAHVEVWDSYPDGSKQAAVFSDLNGEFTVSGLSGGTYDVRAWKEKVPGLETTKIGLYYPTYAFDVPQPYPGKLLLVMVPTPVITWTPYPCDYLDGDSNSTFLGSALRRGDVIGVKDPDQVWCGLVTMHEHGDTTDGKYLIHIYGDDPVTTGVDEGAEAGDMLTFFINNKPATLVGGTGIWTYPGFYEFPLVSSTNDIEAVLVTGPADAFALEGDIVNLDFIVTNKGNHSDAFDLNAASISGWTVSIPGGAATGSLSAGAATTVTVRVEVPTPISSYTTDDIYLLATSQANSSIGGGDKGFIEAGPSAILEEEGVPEQYFLAQNYPNPFNPSTHIAFGLQAGGHTTVTVYNLLGQQVALLLDDYRPPGSHVVTWNGEDNSGRPVPSGIYFYRIQSEEFAQTRKMVLMK